jgi:glycosidase
MTFRKKAILIPVGGERCPDGQVMEFHISAAIRDLCEFEDTLFSSSGNVIFADFRAVQLFAQKYNKTVDGTGHDEWYLKTGQLNAMGLIDEIFHYVCRQYRAKINESFFQGMADAIEKKTGAKVFEKLLETFTTEFPPVAVYRNKITATEWLAANDANGTPNHIIALEELMMLRLANENPAFEPFFRMFSDKVLLKDASYKKAWDAIRSWSVSNPPFGPEGLDLVSMLKAPVDFSPYDLKGQLDYIRTKWQPILGEWLTRLLSGIDLIAEEEKASWSGGGGGGGVGSGYDMAAYEFGDISKEYERFSPDRDWMPNVVLMAKSALVWLSQLSAKYGREIKRLDQIPDEELDFLASAGFTGLWLIGLWERSPASARIKQICGNPEAAASAYSLDDYEIARELGGWEALDNLRARAWKRGVRMASDMVPNHTGMDASWVVEKPDLFVQTRECPFPGYDFNGENLSHDSRVGIYLENHYYSKSDCAVVFKRVDHSNGDTRYIYHGNDGTGMPWNDTAQIDFLSPEAREEVIQKILHVARNFPIIRFDAAMVLAKKHIQRLWYPEPGKGGDIASRSRFAVTREEFERRIPEEFWREVVDRCAREIPDTLLLAEAFWMMEGYFVRTLGMHRVYNSAFMNMLKREENAKYRTTIKNTIEFDPEILKRYVNFMNNPDEETAVTQFGRGDKYFGVCTMMIAMPGLPMFGHGQIEGFEEKYGMEYRRAYQDEKPDEGLVARHRHEIFPLMKKRWLFAGVENFRLYDFWENGNVNENVFVWSNRAGDERALIFYNNAYERAVGWIKDSAASLDKRGDGTKELVRKPLHEALALTVKRDRFCLLQEQRSSLWYLRTTEEIAANGFFAGLDGFQTQVFVSIKEVDDDARGLYRKLYESLEGRGIADIHMGLQNILLKELYKSLAVFASADYFTAIRNGKTDKAFIAEMEPRATQFFETCIEFLDGDFGSASIAGLSKRVRKPDVKTAGKRLSVRLERLLAFTAKRVEKTPAKLSQLPLPGLPNATILNFEESIAAYINADKTLAVTLGGAIALYSLHDLLGPDVTGETIRDLVDLWSLDIKLQELIASQEETDAARTRENLTILKECLVLADIKLSPKNRVVPALVTAFFTQDRTANLLGVHSWDGISWFNKEASERVLSLALVAAAITGKCDEPVQAFYKELGTIKKTILAAFGSSGYQTEKLKVDVLEKVKPKKAKLQKVKPKKAKE